MSFKKAGAPMVFNVLVKQEDDLFVAHCLELDVVTASKRRGKVLSDIKDLIIAQVDYAFSNNNLDYLYRSAPPEVWKEFYDCKKLIEEETVRELFQTKTRGPFLPPWIVARMCELSKPCHA